MKLLIRLTRLTLFTLTEVHCSLGMGDQSGLLGQHHPEGFLDTLTGGPPGIGSRLPPPPRSLFQPTGAPMPHPHPSMMPQMGPAPTSTHPQYFGPPGAAHPQGPPPPPGIFQAPRLANSVHAAAAAAALALGNGSTPTGGPIPTSMGTGGVAPPSCFMPSSLMQHSGDEEGWLAFRCNFHP